MSRTAVAARRLALFGTDEAPASRRTLQAGPLRCVFSGGALQAVSWHGTELLRGVAWLLRDTDWGTVPARVRVQRVKSTVDSFTLRARLTMQHQGATLDAQLLLEGRVQSADAGQITLSVGAVADRPLLSNRCGLVLLHPAACAGLPLRVTQGSAPPSDTAFPLLIQPAQPVFDIRAMQWSPQPGVAVDCTLEAELPGLRSKVQASFEMEDQRNWSDASFKTYVGSLRDPWPYELPAGVQLSQRLVLRVQGRAAAGRGASEAPLRIGAETGQRMPPLGLGVPHLDRPPNADEQRAVAALRPGWLVVQVELDRPDVQQQLQTAVALARASGAQLQLDVLCPQGLSPDDCAARTAAACAGAGCEPAALRLCPSAYLQSYQPDGVWPDVPPLQDYAAAAAVAFPQARIGGGMVTFFTELNRKRQPAKGIAFIAHSTCPTVHAADDEAVMQTLQSLPAMAASVRAHWPGLGWRLGPSSIATLRNPYGSAPAANPQLQRIALAQEDPRHHAQFGAAWCAAYAATAAQLGAELVSLLHSHGPNGPMARHGSGRVPAWAALRLLASWAGAPLLGLSDLPDGVVGLACTGAAPAEVRLLLVNTQGRSCSVPLALPMQRLDIDTGLPTRQRPSEHLRLNAYGLALASHNRDTTP